MRPTPFLLLALLALPPAVAQGGAALATLDIVVGADRAESMTLTFDHLRRLTQYNGICLPAGARESRVYDDVGDVQYQAREEDGRRTLSFLARSEKVVVDMARAAPDDDEHPLHKNDANFCVPTGADVVVTVTVPADHTLFYVSDGGVITGQTGRAEHDGPTHVFYAYEAPMGGSAALEVFEAGAFRVFAPPAAADRAREVAALARAPFDAAAREAGLALPFDRLRVLYVSETEFDWEAGHYNGNGYVTVKLETLSGEPTQGYPYTAVKVLVHEAFHALSFPYGRGAVEDTLSWWLEGSARHGERQVDVAMPNATRFCERSATEVRCYDFDDRIKRADLEIAYAPSFTFQDDWEPSLPQSDDTRKFYYAYSDFLVAAYVERYGVAAYQAAWDAVEAALLRGEGCPCADGWLEGVLAAKASATPEDITRPYAALRKSDVAVFTAKVTPFVRDEEGLRREVERQANPLSAIPSPWWAALLALAAVALTRRRG